jgi:hypothetical protein
MKFSMTIELGNSAMTTSDDLRKVIKQVGEYIVENDIVQFVDIVQFADHVKIYAKIIQDDYGNHVGTWKISKD